MAPRKSIKKTVPANEKKTRSAAVKPAGETPAAAPSKSDDPEENLKRLARTPLAMNFVKTHNGAWNHQDWLNFLRDIEARGYFPIDADRVGLLLEDKKKVFNAK